MLRVLFFSHIRSLGGSIELEQHTPLLTTQTAAKVTGLERKSGTTWHAIEENSVISFACSLAGRSGGAAGKGSGEYRDNWALMNPIVADIVNSNTQTKIKTALEPNRIDYDGVGRKE
ncbi:TPA_exp: hypothetical protein A8136_6986 [Trichophyton benhamiae CBS 112371]|nr:TPA_exp: hypothetical protein A8136_6986 [Trichophyton benhamiae CBS 112371]